MSTESKTSSGGIGLVILQTIVFITLKLLGSITWSWWWVLSPIWITVAIFLVVLFIVVALSWSR
jgi:hypothetical protein